MSDFTIPGYTVLGEIDTSMEAYDNASLTLVLWREETGGVYALYAGGCNCGSQGGCGCGIYDDVKAADVEPVTDMLTFAQSLYDSAVGVDDENATDAVRNALRAIAARLPWMATPPAIG